MLISYDLKTSGLDVENDVVEVIGAVAFDPSGTIHDTFRYPLPGKAGFVAFSEFLNEYAKDEAVSPRGYVYEVASLIGYNNNAFDDKFLAREKDVFLPYRFPCFDLLVIFRSYRLFKYGAYGPANNRLTSVCDWYGVALPKPNDPMDDCKAVARLFPHIMGDFYDSLKWVTP